jgi:ADP-heptose:LPS heptosyltransferase
VGIGDEIIATGEVRRRAAGTQRRFAIVDRHGAHRWHEVFENNPRIARPGERADELITNGPHCRPYIAEQTPDRYRFRAYEPSPGELFFTADELKDVESYRGAILIEPHTKPGAPKGKQWPRRYWQKLANLGRRLPLIQVGPPGVSTLREARFVRTLTFRRAAAILSVCRAAVLPEGGLHHAAAAVGVPSVVIYGGFISPAVTGYAMHTNIFAGGDEFPLGCGNRRHCEHCEAAMASITPATVFEALQGILNV